ncbi:MAG: hypothetical protein VB875_13070, partial [Pirellulales bacterium]
LDASLEWVSKNLALDTYESRWSRFTIVKLLGMQIHATLYFLQKPTYRKKHHAEDMLSSIARALCSAINFVRASGQKAKSIRL